MFFGMTLIVYFDNSRYLRRPVGARRILLGSGVIPLLFGGAIEVAQGLLTSYRSGEWADFIFDGGGVALGLLLCYLINRRLKRRNHA
jgi:VanZ family protein